MAKIVVYSTPTCPYCVQVKEYFKQNDLEFIDYNVADDQTKAKEMVEKSGQMGVPVVDIDGNVIVGFNKPEIDKFLKI